MPWRVMNALAKSFELSSRAAARVGPKILRPSPRNASTMPAASGASGPTTVSVTCSRCAKRTSAAMSVTSTLTIPSSRAVPALPGATKTFATRGELAIFQASACSRPPPPTTRIFNAPPPSLQVDLAEDIENAAVIDPAIELGDVGRQDFNVVVPQRSERQHRGKRYPVPDVRPLHDHRREAEPELELVALAPVRPPGVAQVELCVPVRVPEYEEEHVFLILRFVLARAVDAAAPSVRDLLGAALGRPAIGKVPLIARDQQRVVS